MSLSAVATPSTPIAMSNLAESVLFKLARHVRGLAALDHASETYTVDEAGQVSVEEHTETLRQNPGEKLETFLMRAAARRAKLGAGPMRVSNAGGVFTAWIGSRSTEADVQQQLLKLGEQVAALSRYLGYAEALGDNAPEVQAFQLDSAEFGDRI